jgi:ribonucleoside-triphosphate reductase
MKYAKKIDPSFIDEFKDRTPPWGPIGYVTYKRTYARMTEAGVTEEWWQTIERCCNGLLDIGGAFSQDEIQRLFLYIFQLKCNFSGRALWQLGTPTVERLGGDSLQNCWHVVINDPIDPFTFAFNELMLGGGVGFNLQPEHVYELPPVRHVVKIERVDTYDCDFIVPDNREGWVELLERVLKAFFYTGRNFSYNTRAIRPKGQLIRSFGGIASGSEDLVKGIAQIGAILQSRLGQKLRPIDCLDIMNIIGSVVVAGNVRRSAEIACGSPTDKEFIGAKDWSRFKIPAHRQMSNNSVITSDIGELSNDFWRGYEGNGEPYGLINLENCRRFGRLADGPGYRPDHDVVGVNPCGEITLASHEACNLAEIYLPRISDIHEFEEAARLQYMAVKTISMLPFIHPKTNAIVTKNRRLGIGVTGFCAAQHLHNPGIFDAVYESLEDFDKEYSRTIRSNESIKLTTVKPSGTNSLLPGVPPGVHPDYSPHYIRRITFAANDPLVEVAREYGYHVEPKVNLDKTRDLNTMVVDFPIKVADGTITAKDLTAVQQLENQLFLQRHWSDNSVSMTCYYRPGELPGIKAWLKDNYKNNVKTASFLLHSEHGFDQAPYQEITAEQYAEMAGKVRPITQIVDRESRSILESVECGTGGCPIK